MRTFLITLLMLFSMPALAQTNRPQTPVAPFPYEVIDVTVPVHDQGTDEQTHTLGATITMPDADEFGDGPYVGVVLMSGSGMQDRDSTVFEHKPFMVIADYLTRRGIAVLRYDDRVVGDSTGSVDGLTTQDLAHDGHEAARFLMKYDRIDPDRVGVIGHSEGGGHVAYIGARDESVAFLISLAGVGVRGVELMIDQTAAMYRDMGKDEEYIATAMDIRRAIFEAGIDGEDEEEILNLIVELNMHEYGIKEANDVLRNTSRGMIPMFAGSWMSSFAAYDPGQDWARVSGDVPVLAMNGSKDFQVSPKLNLGGIRAGLVAGRHNNYTIVELGALNHLFQHAQSGMLAEYNTIEETFAPEALVQIESWIRTEIIEQD
jgi:pimeloyl-ACP methyl ester carboxylesterase